MLQAKFSFQPQHKAPGLACVQLMEPPKKFVKYENYALLLYILGRINGTR